ncbi:MAG: BamA/TamA family outer membrane protein [bacterium]|nr:BamA/TamA family outer membrane protein [bacterium]
MKKDVTASISGTGNGARILLAVLILTVAAAYIQASPLQHFTIKEICFKSGSMLKVLDAKKYDLLLDLKPGTNFSYKKIRKSMDNLYKTGLFSNLKIEIEKLDKNTLNLFFLVTPKYVIEAIKVRRVKNIKKSSLLKSIFSIRKNTWFEPGMMKPALQEIRNFLSSRGYYNPSIDYKIIKNDNHSTAKIYFYIKNGPLTTVDKITFTVPDQKILQQAKQLFNAQKYIPFQFQKGVEGIKKFLKEKNYYYPIIKIEESFTTKEKSEVNLNIVVKPGYKYIFRFKGIKNRIGLIATIWEKKVFEEWAEKESKARILYYLKNKGYLNAEVQCTIETNNLTKYITFEVDKKKKYKLGKITFKGNKSFPEQEMRRIIKSDDLFYDKVFAVRSRSLRVDQAVLRLYYYFKGYPNASILMEPHFRKKKVDIDFIINEGQKHTVETVLFSGNRHFDSDMLSGLIETRNNGPFVQQKLTEDIEKLRSFYRSRGFDAVEIAPEISPGAEKSILLTITEGNSNTMGNLIIVGASDTQELLLKKLFPLKTGEYLDQPKIDAFKGDIENAAIFNEFRITILKKSGDVVDVLVKAMPDKSKYYGFGFGWEDEFNIKGTLEYQEPNIFGTYSSLSTIIQGGTRELRGILSYNTPYFFRQKLNSEFKFWADNEIFPSYKFNRYGISEAVIKKISSKSYIMMSLSWNRTMLKELKINSDPLSVDQLDIPFHTGIFHLSFVRENRDNPFNPTSGNFFSSDLKAGVSRFAKTGNALTLIENNEVDAGLFEKTYPFFKFRWSYQKNFKFFKTGTLAFSIRNGLAFGDTTITERFFAGGVNSFRGTKLDRLGPYDIVTDAETSEISRQSRGGNALVLFNLEATFPLSIIPGDDFYYAIFADFGNVFDQVRNIRLKDMEKAIGFSLKIKTELGPLRFDFAWKLGKRKIFNGQKDDSFVWHIGFGNVL